MDIIVNDYSLVGQFSDKEEFIETLIKTTIPILKEIKEKNYNLFKKTDFYAREICYKETLNTVLFNTPSHPAIQIIKMYLIALTRDEPFWDSSPFSPPFEDGSEFQCSFSSDYPSCFSEVYHRKAILLSFIHPSFKVEEFTVNIKGSIKQIYNAYDLHSFSKHLLAFGEAIPPTQKNSFIICNDCLFEIRFSETNHSIAHFHVTKSNSNISIKIADLSILSGSLPSSTYRMVLEWARGNITLIKDLWNTFHPEKEIS